MDTYFYLPTIHKIWPGLHYSEGYDNDVKTRKDIGSNIYAFLITVQNVIKCVLISILKLFTTVTENKLNSNTAHIFSSDLGPYRAPSRIDSSLRIRITKDVLRYRPIGAFYRYYPLYLFFFPVSVCAWIYYTHVVQELKFAQRHCWKFDGKVFNIGSSRFFHPRLKMVVKWPFAVGFRTLRVEKEHKRFPIRLVFFALTKTRLLFPCWHFNNNSCQVYCEVIVNCTGFLSYPWTSNFTRSFLCHYKVGM